MTDTARRHWLLGVTVLLAAQYALIGFAASGAERTVGILGAAAIVASLAVARKSRPAAAALLVLGAAPLAILTWWSIVTPVLAICCLTFGWPRRATGR